MIDKILDDLGLEYKEAHNRYVMPCPIHGGSNPNACVVYKNGIFQCFTGNCHESGASLESFVSRTLNISYNEAKKWLKSRGVSNKTKNNFDKSTNILTQKVKVLTHKIPISSIKKKYNGPSSYYLEKGFKDSVLRAFLVGIYEDKERVTVPIFDKKFEYCIGYSSRSIHPKCPLCDQYHNPIKHCQESPKWKHSYKLCKNSVFYNQWNLKSKTCFLVEGTGDVWRMFQAGFKNTLGLLGTGLSVDQRILLESSGVTSVVTFLDPDEKGKKGAENIERYASSLYNYYNIEYHKEPADCTEEELNDICIQYC